MSKKISTLFLAIAMAGMSFIPSAVQAQNAQGQISANAGVGVSLVGEEIGVVGHGGRHATARAWPSVAGVREPADRAQKDDRRPRDYSFHGGPL